MAKVLIIDSDAEAAQALQGALSAEGVVCEALADGNEALVQVRSLQPDAIVLCVELSRISGYSICNKLKKDPALNAIPLILTSSQATDETFEQHKKLKTRAEGYLKKPYAMDDLLALLAPFTGLRPRAATARAAAARPAARPTQSDAFALDELDEPAPPTPAPRPSARRLSEPDFNPDAELEAEPEPVRPAARRPARSASQELDLDADLSLPPARPAARAPTPMSNEPTVNLGARPKIGQPAEAAIARPKSSSSEFNLDDLDSAPAPVSVPRPRARAPEPLPEGDLEPTPTRPRPRAADGEPSAPVAAPRAAPAGDGAGGEARAEVRALRQKVQQLEQALEQKDLEFNDRLLQESARSRDAVDLKKKIAVLERDLARAQQLTDQTRGDLEESQGQTQALQEQLRSLHDERESAGEQAAQLADRVQTLESDKQALQAQLEDGRQAQEAVQQELDSRERSRQKAKKAVDIALQLLEETGLLPQS